MVPVSGKDSFRGTTLSKGGPYDTVTIHSGSVVSSESHRHVFCCCVEAMVKMFVDSVLYICQGRLCGNRELN